MRQLKTATTSPIRLPQELADRMDEVADELGYSRAALIRQAIKLFVTNREKEAA